MRARWASALAAALVIVLGTGAAASATDPPALGEGRVLDLADVLTPAEVQSVEDRSEELSESAGIDLWVVYVDDFTSPSSAADWANDVAADNGLGPHQYLLAVATEGRMFYLSADTSGPVSEDAVATIERDDVQPELADADWAGAAIAAADGLEAAVDGGPGGGQGGSGAPVLLILLGLAAAGVAVWFVVRAVRRRKAAREDEQALGDLARQAASALVATDDALKTSAQEVGFARAQFGEESTAEFEAALVEARERLDQAFHLQQQLDDDVPDSPEQQRAWLTEILALCEAASTALDEKAAAFDELRKLEQNAPEALARVQEERNAAVGRADAAAAQRDALAATYDAAALAAVADNPEQARARLAFADERLAAAQAAIGAGDGAEAAVAIRSAQQAIAQAHELTDAVGSLRDDLAAADANAEALIADLEKDLAAAAAMSDASGRLAPVVAGTKHQVDTARAQLRSNARRPDEIVTALDRANTEIDTLMAGIRTEREQAERARAVLAQTLLQARAQVSSAQQFITARRGGVGAAARTRLAEADAALSQATVLQDQDPAQALVLARRADALSHQAIQHAQEDVGAFSSGGGSSGGDVFGAMLGGIILGGLTSGGGRGRSGGFGGGFSGGRSFGGGGGRSASRPSRSFGGSRSRRGGGRF